MLVVGSLDEWQRPRRAQGDVCLTEAASQAFVRITEDRGHTVLTVPDLLGNFHFATFGNILLNRSEGLSFHRFNIRIGCNRPGQRAWSTEAGGRGLV